MNKTDTRALWMATNFFLRLVYEKCQLDAKWKIPSYLMVQLLKTFAL